ncbi:MAG: sensor signal transduction histidine kinase [Variovorax sp.]|nr:sensor signal transduction histidine kinase [Variovorax sp.]
MPESPPTLPAAEQLLDEFPSGLLVTSTSGLILKVNLTFCNWVGMTAEELVGLKRLQELFTMGGRIFHQTHWLPTLQMQGSLSEVKLDVRHKDGRTMPMMMNAIRRTGATGSYDEIAVVVAEERNKYERELVAARKRADELVLKERSAQEELTMSQARLRQALRIGALFLWDVDVASGRRRYEDDAARLLGYEAQRAVTEAMYAGAIAPHDREKEAAAFARAIDSNDRASDSYQSTYRLNGVDGVQRIVVSSGQGFFDQDGALVQFVGVLSDVTESTRQRAMAEDRALFAEQMVGIVSHDLRNPLSAILMGVKLLAHAETAPRKVRVLGHVTSSATRAQRLIEELLDFTQARVGRGIAVAPKPFDLHACISTIVDELALAFPERRIVHERRGDGNVIADPDRIAQLLGNLVGNAVAYGVPEGTITVITSVDSTTATLLVHNTGDAIPEAQIASLFEPMVRGVPGDSGTRSVGLGLYIVKAIASAHRGEMAVTSSREKGTSFVFSFPR